jgi:hypothetical protein
VKAHNCRSVALHKYLSTKVESGLEGLRWLFYRSRVCLYWL